MKAVDTTSTLLRLSEGTEYKADNPSQDRLVIKNGSHFLITDERGMMPKSKGEPAPFGLFRDDTRYLSAWQLYINGTQPRLLASEIDRGYEAKFVYGNARLEGIPEQSIMIARSLVISDGLHEKITVTNFHTEPVECELAIVFDADFTDMFEVRGSKRPKRGVRSAAEVTSFQVADGDPHPADLPKSGKKIVFNYRGLDKYTMRTVISLRADGVEPEILNDGVAVYKLKLPARHSQTIDVACGTWTDARFMGVPFDLKDTSEPNVSYDTAFKNAQGAYRAWRATGATITTGSTTMNDILDRGYRDLFILRQATPKGTCIAAGTPWFACAFGRDQAVTALELLPVFPTLARDVIDVLAAYQGTRNDDYTEERPGKIMHELRLGEMARVNEIPFKPYYGTVDATPLWLMLVARYVKNTGDIETARRVWPNVEKALAFLDGEVAKNGYLCYGGKEGAALSNQGWKDSFDSVMYSNGKLAKAPIALCEPQGYLYEAWSSLGEIAQQLGHKDLSKSLTGKAAALKKRFNKDFWMPKHNFVAIALDGDQKQCDVVSSNPGHILSTGILEDDMAQLVADRLMAPDMFCGWGIRTLSDKEAAYNPMSYHDGSVWPHDNALAVQGLAAVGHKKDALRVMEGLRQAAEHQPDMRLPELFCGFAKEDTGAPIRYPVSCVPQAWAAGSMFQILMSCLGLELNAGSQSLRIVKPELPAWLGDVTVTGLPVGDARVDLKFTTSSGKTNVTVLKKTGTVNVKVCR